MLTINNRELKKWEELYNLPLIIYTPLPPPTTLFKEINTWEIKLIKSQKKPLMKN